MKALSWIAWISAGLGVLLIFFAGLTTLTGNYYLGADHRVNYFQIANTFFLITIALFVFLYRCQCKKE
jgi:hypothetical protein